jgi:ribosomal-protein-serine acetyltransferase
MDDFKKLVLVGKRLTLRSVNPDDSRQLFSAINESRSDLKEFLPWVEMIRSVEDEDTIVAQWNLEMQIKTALHLCILADKKLVGLISTHQIDWINRKVGFGYWIRSSERGKGFATKAAAMLTSYLFESLGLNRVEVQASTMNAASNAVIRKLGYTQEGILRQAMLIGDTFHDLFTYGLLRDEYERLKVYINSL